GPLDEAILAERAMEPAVLAECVVTADVPYVKTALDGARDIIAEGIAENADLLGRLRAHMRQASLLKAIVVDGKQATCVKF
ncbi:RNA-binding transcriptional accessory protein, partial [Rhizobium brockwellii]